MLFFYLASFKILGIFHLLLFAVLFIYFPGLEKYLHKYLYMKGIKYMKLIGYNG